jgi:maltose alpha-D-glucosyltransferase / alpha-amylase
MITMIPHTRIRTRLCNTRPTKLKHAWTYSPQVQAIHGSPKALWKRLENALLHVYGPATVANLMPTIFQQLQKSRQTRPTDRQALDDKRAVDWVKDEVVYMLYPERFGVGSHTNHAEGKIHGDFDAIREQLPYLKSLGVTTLYILPFMSSPLGDAGFDVSDYTNVREDLGGLEAFRRFRDNASAMGFKLKSDLILNHISDQHPWFQQALAGNPEKLDYFVYRKEAPLYKRYRDEQRGIVCDYTEADGSISSRRLMFPDQVECHYRLIHIDSEDYYFYHSFYPFQVDLNWENPNVLLDVLNVIAFWVNEGVDIFRLDAIPYLIKDFGTDGENRPRTHSVVEAMSCFLQLLAPSTIFQAEACQWPQDILPYFGTADSPTHRSSEVQVCYHFPVMPAIWGSLLEERAALFWQAIEETPAIPATCAWAMFLRVHDELTLEMTDVNTRKRLYEKLESKGESFRSGLGVSGRLASFLDEDPRRIIKAYALLLSLPGLPIIYFGDELGEVNNTRFAQDASAQRLAMIQSTGQTALSSTYDSRDINRSPLTAETLSRVLKRRHNDKGVLFQQMKGLIETRLASEALRRGDLTPLRFGPHASASLLAFQRQSEHETVWVLINLSASAMTLDLSQVMDLNQDSKPHFTFKDLLNDEVMNEHHLRLAPYAFRFLKHL